ncbi:MAG TPA: ATP-binding protein [Rhodocyclaceae bacterium]
MTPRSILARLLLPVLLALLLIGGTSAVATYIKALHEADEVFDAQMEHTARLGRVTVPKADDDDKETDDEHGHPRHRYELDESVALWRLDKDGWQVIAGAAALRGMPTTLLANTGFHSAAWGGAEWRLLVRAGADARERLVVAQPAGQRGHMAGEVAWHALQPFLLGLPILAVVLMALGYHALRPLRQLAAELAARAPDRLDPVRVDQPPSELQPVLTALNTLLARVGEVLAHERRFTSNAAHELRTPLAALAMQLQVAQRATDAAGSRDAVEKARLGAERMARLVDQLLQLARLEGSEGGIALQPTDVVVLAQEVCATLAVGEAGQQRELALDAPDHLQLTCQPDLLRVLLRNLVDNALRYTPVGGHVQVRLSGGDGVVTLRVEDDGPGVPEPLRASLGEPFNRLASAAGNLEDKPEGVGLGLSIVRRIAELHGARLVWSAADAEGRGLVAILSFPA